MAATKLGEAVVQITMEMDGKARQKVVDAARETGEAAATATVKPQERVGKEIQATHERVGKAAVQFYDRNGKAITDTVMSGQKVTSGRYLAGMNSMLGKVGGGFKSMATKSVSVMGSTLKTGVSGAAAGVMATLGVALTKGFKRLSTLDQATAKLQGLGNSAKVTSAIMKDALVSVKGTAFGMDEAASTAAMVVAAGVKPGKDLQKTLKLTADSATIAGMSMSDMGRIFGSVAAKGKLQGDDLMQLTSAGIPVLQMLGKSMHMTAAQASDLVSKGKVDFPTFQKAMEQGLGGAAASSGKTFTGAMKNVSASLGRIGANFLSGVFPKMAPMFSAITTAMGPLEDKAKAFGQTLSSKVNPLVDKFTKLLQGGLPHIQAVPQILGPAVAAFAALGAGGLAPVIGMIPGLGGLASKMSLLASPVGLVAAAFLGLVAVSPELRAALGNVAKAVTGLFTGMSKNMAPVTKQLVPLLTSAMNGVAHVVSYAFNTLADGIRGMGGAFKSGSPAISGFLSVVVGLGSVLKGLYASLSPVIGMVVKLVGGAVLGALVLGFQALGVILKPVGALLGWIGGLMQRHASIVSSLVAYLGTLVGVYAGLMVMKDIIAWTKGASIAFKVLGGYVKIYTGIQKALNLVLAINPWFLVIAALVAVGVAIAVLWKRNAAFRNAILAAWGGIKSFFSAIGGWFSGPFVNGIKTALSAVGGFFSGAWDGIKSAWSAVGGFFSGVWKAISDAFTAGVNAVVGFVKTYWPVIAVVITGGLALVPLLVVKYWDQITGAFQAAWNWISGVFGALWAGLVNIFGPPFDTIRKIVEVFSAALVMLLQGIWNWVSGTFSSLWSGVVNIFGAVWGAISAAASAFWAAEVLGFQNIWNWVSGTFSKLWSGVVGIFGAVWGAISAAATWFWTTEVQGFQNIWNWVSGTFRKMWGGVVGIFTSVWNSVRGATSSAMAALRGFFNGIWGWVSGVFSKAWNGVRNIMYGPINAGRNAIHSAWNSVTSKFTAVKNWIGGTWTKGWNAVKGWITTPINQAGNAVHAALNNVVRFFSSSVTAIGKAWSGIKHAMSAPIKFTADNIVNPMIDAFNSLADKVGMKRNRLSRWNFKGFRTGGYTGDGAPGEVAGLAHKGEYYFSAPEVSRAGGRKRMDMVRAQLASGHWPVGPTADEISPNQNAPRSLPIPSSLLRSLPTNLQSVIARGPLPGDKGMGGPAGQAAVRWGMGLVGSNGWYRRCLAFVNQAWGSRISGLMKATARISMNSVPRRMDGTPPPGAAVYWDTGGSAGHVALSVGDGTELSNDIVSPGMISRVPSSTFASKWGAKYMGWYSPDGSKPGADSSWLAKIKGFIGSVAGGAVQMFGRFATPFEFLADKVKGFFSKHSPIKKFGNNAVTGLVEAAAKKVTSGAVNKLKSFFGGGGTPGKSGNMESWRSMVRSALARSGIGGGKSDEDKWLRQIMTESSGNPRLVQSSAVNDINVQRGDPARGLVQVPGVTWADFGRDMGSFIPNVYDAFKNLVVGMRAAKAQHRNWRNVIGFGHGYKRGTLAASTGWHLVGENGPEMRWFSGGERVLNSSKTRTALNRLQPLGSSASASSPSRGGDTYGDISIQLSMDDLSQLNDLQALLDLLKKSRGVARRTMRSGTVTV